MMDTIIYTTLKRPYVLAFLISYILISWKVLRIRFTVTFLIIGYFIAFVSEYSSINYGIPYGWYHYIYENLKGEWIFKGVPVWDSASYVFMCFSSLCAARLTLKHKDMHMKTNQFLLVFISAILTTTLDIIVDPISHMGERWFLGKIYYYPEPGYYFDITFANFIGWFVTSYLINFFAVFVLNFLKFEKILHNKINQILPIGLYYGIFGFGLVIAMYLQEWLLVLADSFWLLFTLTIIFGKDCLHALKKKRLSTS